MILKKTVLFSLLSCTALLTSAEINPKALNPVRIEKAKDAAPVTLFENGKSNAVIVIPSEKEDCRFPWMPYIQSASRKKMEYQGGVARYAALELQNILEQAGGVKIPVVTSNQTIPAGKSLILVGMSRTAEEHGLNNADVAREGFKVQVFNEGIAILGSPLPPAAPLGDVWDSAYGVIFGVYDFAERFLDARFYYPGPDGTLIPKLSVLTVPAVVYKDAPLYECRKMYSWQTQTLPGVKDMDPMEIALRYRSGGHGPFGATALPIHAPPDPVTAGMPPALDKNGRPIQTIPIMPCMGRPDAADTFLRISTDAKNGRLSPEKARAYGMTPQNNILRFMPPDHSIQCQCPSCAPLLDNAVPFHGQGRNIFGKFIRETAEKMKTASPDTTLYFAPYYNYTAPAKGLVLPDNTKALICLMYGQSVYHDPAIRRYTTEWIRDWKKITGKPVQVYVYPNWPGIDYSPFPRQYYHNLKQFVNDFKGEVTGLFSDGPNSGGIQAIEGGFYAYTLPSTYCLFRLMWNPDYDVDAGVADMCKRMYGPAAPHMDKIISGIAKLWEGPATTNNPDMLKLGNYEAGVIRKNILYDKIIRPEFVKMLKNELDAAYQAVPKDSADYRRIDLFGKTLQLFFMDYDNYHNPKLAARKNIVLTEMPFKPKFEDKIHLPEWDKVPKQYFVNAYLSHVPDPPQPTTVQAAYDPKGLLLKFTMTEPAMDQIQNEDRTKIWNGDCVEIFVEYTPGSIYQYTVNSENTRRDNFIGKPPKKRLSMPYHLAEKGNGVWTLTTYFPFVTLDANHPFDAKIPVSANFVRTRKLKDGSAHVSRWSTTFARRHADESAFGILTFETEGDGKK